MKDLRIINIIPEQVNDENKTYRNALGYPWQNLDKKIPGLDVVMGEGKYQDVHGKIIADLSEEFGDVYTVPCQFPHRPENAVALITGMWCGGESTYVCTGKSKNVKETESAPMDAEESAILEKKLDAIDLAEQDASNKKNPGYCVKCHTYCYGDCESA